MTLRARSIDARQDVPQTNPTGLGPRTSLVDGSSSRVRTALAELRGLGSRASNSGASATARARRSEASQPKGRGQNPASAWRSLPLISTSIERTKPRLRFFYGCQPLAGTSLIRGKCARKQRVHYVAPRTASTISSTTASDSGVVRRTASGIVTNKPQSVLIALSSRSGAASPDRTARISAQTDIGA